MASERIELEIVLDDGNVVKGFANVEKAAEKAGKKSGSAFGDGFGMLGKASLAVTGINQGLELAAKAADAVGAALRFAFNLSSEAEAINAINRQFDVLTQRAGIAGDALSSALMKASDGLVDDDGLMRAANMALIEMGESAEKLPEIMETARKATAAFGGDLLQNFEAMNQAILSGNTRALKHMGIFIDVDGATKKYARSLGITSDMLSKAGRQQAILNAVLEKGKTAFKDIEPTQKVTDAFTRLKVAITDSADEMKKAFNGAFGPLLEKMADKAAASTNRFTDAFKFAFSSQEERLKMIQGDLKKAQEERLRTAIQGIDMSKLQDPFAGKIVMPGEEKPKPKTEDHIDDTLVKARRRQIEEQLFGINNSAFAAKEALVAQMADGDAKIAAQDALAGEKRLLIKNEYDARIAELQRQNLETMGKDKDLYAQAEVALEQEKQDRIKAIQDASYLEMQRKQHELDSVVTNGFKNVMTNAIAGFAGALAKGGDAMSEFGKSMLGMLGDLSIQLGSVLLFSGMGMLSLGEFNPMAAIAAGAGLIALGGILKAFSDNGKGATSSAGLAGGGSSHITERPDVEEQRGRTDVTVNIQGHVLDRKETGMAITEILREQFYANDNRVVSIA